MEIEHYSLRGCEVFISLFNKILHVSAHSSGDDNIYYKIEEEHNLQQVNKFFLQNTIKWSSKFSMLPDNEDKNKIEDIFIELIKIAKIFVALNYQNISFELLVKFFVGITEAFIIVRKRKEFSITEVVDLLLVRFLLKQLINNFS